MGRGENGSSPSVFPFLQVINTLGKPQKSFLSTLVKGEYEKICVSAMFLQVRKLKKQNKTLVRSKKRYLKSMTKKKSSKREGELEQTLNAGKRLTLMVSHYAGDRGCPFNRL